MEVSRRLFAPLLILLMAVCGGSCEGETEALADAVRESDSLPFMHSTGVNTLISDSGYMRYHMVAEEWDIYSQGVGDQATWKFRKGLLMQRLDRDYHIDLHVEADTAYLHRQKLWELRGRVRVRNQQGDLFLTEELFWDMNKHEMWSHKYMHIITTERELEGDNFRSNEQMTRYSVTNSAGVFPVNDTSNEPEEPVDSGETTGDAAPKQPLNPEASTADKLPLTPATVTPKTSRFEPAPNKRTRS